MYLVKVSFDGGNKETGLLTTQNSSRQNCSGCGVQFGVNSTICGQFTTVYILQHHLRLVAFLISLKSSTPRGFTLNLFWL